MADTLGAQLQALSLDTFPGQQLEKDTASGQPIVDTSSVPHIAPTNSDGDNAAQHQLLLLPPQGNSSGTETESPNTGVQSQQQGSLAGTSSIAQLQGQQQGSSRHMVAGGGQALQALRELIGWPQLYGQQAAQLGVRWPRGLLLHGPPGCGKTLMVQAVAEEFGAVLHTVTAGDVFGAYVGQSERRLREAFEAAAQDVAAGHTAVVFLDEVDALCPRRDGQRAHESRVVAQLLTLLDGTGSIGTSASLSSTQQAHHSATPLVSGLPPGYRIIKVGAAIKSVGLAHSGSRNSGRQGHLVVVGATNRPNALDPALRRPGRLDREVSMSVPDAAQRAAILAAHTAGLQLHPDLDLASIATQCHGYSGADLAALAREAVLVALSDAASSLLTQLPPPPTAALQGTHNRSHASHDSGTPAGAVAGTASIQHHNRPTWVATRTGSASTGTAAEQDRNKDTGVGIAAIEAMDEVAEDGGTGKVPAGAAGVVRPAHFAAAMRRVGPSIVRGAEVEVPNASWDDIGGLDDVKRRLRQSVEWPLKHRAAFTRLGLSPPKGVLLYGPPGCSKTSLARAAASASGATLLPLSCAQLFSMYVGEGEALLRDMFRRARLAAPSILLLDEVDAMAARRDEGDMHGGGEAGLRLLTCLLTEMDGAEDTAAGVLVLATTNRPQAVDAALLRPGRFDTLLYVPPPDQKGRLQVLKVHTRNMPLAADVDLTALAAVTQGYTGAELAGLCREAALAALREDFEGAQQVAHRHFEAARAGSRAPALSPLTLAAFEHWAAGRKAHAISSGSALPSATAL